MLLGLLTSIVVVAVLGLVTRTLTMTDLNQLLASLGLTTHIGTAIGFYFGRASSNFSP